jgi:hypothetical protein
MGNKTLVSWDLSESQHFMFFCFAAAIFLKERERELGGGSLPLASARLRGLPLPPQRGSAPQRPVLPSPYELQVQVVISPQANNLIFN